MRRESMSELWVEKHRPQSVAQIKGQAAVVQRLGTYAEQEFPTLLFAAHRALEKQRQRWR